MCFVSFAVALLSTTPVNNCLGYKKGLLNAIFVIKLDNFRSYAGFLIGLRNSLLLMRGKVSFFYHIDNNILLKYSDR